MVLNWVFRKLLWGNAFTTEQGRIRLFGKMDWSMLPSRTLAINLQTIAEENGPDFLYDLGYRTGKDAAREIIKYMGLRPRGGWTTQKAVISLLEFIGFGKPQFIKTEITDEHHHIILRVSDNPVIEHAVRIYGSKSMVCKWFMGTYAAHGEMELGIKHTVSRENKCMRLGSPFCEWETKS